MDKRKQNGGHSTKSKSKYDKRKKGSFENVEMVESFVNDIKIQMVEFYKQVFRNKLKEVIADGYYVYKHTVNDEVVYIGKGIGDRMYRKFRLNDEHNDLLYKGLIKYEIIASGMSNETAYMVEEMLIKIYKPIYNIQLNN